MLAAAAGAFAQQAQGTEASSTVPAAAVAGIMFGMGILMPVIYGVMGFIGAAVYNLVARWIGGIELEVE
jgi:hypothetical protein